jgi:hypothetical protein
VTTALRLSSGRCRMSSRMKTQTTLSIFLLLLLFILTANGFSPGGSGTTIRHHTQNNTTIKQNTVHKTTHTINTLHRMKIQQSQLQLYKVFYYLMRHVSYAVCEHSLCVLKTTTLLLNFGNHRVLLCSSKRRTL